MEKDYKTARELWLPLAEKGDSRAQFFLGFMHDFGFGVPEDDKEAVKWYRLAAEQGDSRAQLFVGIMYDSGLGVPQDDLEAIKWYQLAADQGYDEARENILKLKQRNVQQAEQGFSEATKIDLKLEQKNVQRALKVLTDDAEKGIAKAQHILGFLYDFGAKTPEDDQKAAKWYRLAAEQELASVKTIVSELTKGNNLTVLKILVGDGENGVADAQIKLGAMYQFGFIVPEDDKKAAQWYRLAAEQGDSSAQFIVGLISANGQGIIKDGKEAMRWCRLAVEKRVEMAEVYSLAKESVPQALKILTRDAEKGIDEAQNNLGYMYEFGTGVPQDYVLAHMWYNLSGLQGNETAIGRLNILERKMSPRQLAKAQEVGRNWKPKK